MNNITTTKRLVGKVALVTGGSRGIGAAIALRLAEEGATVAISYIQNTTAAREIVDKIKEMGSQALAFKANVSSPEETQELIDNINKSVGKIDILVNNAGIFESAHAEKIDLDHYQRVFDVNVKGVIVTTITALKNLSDGGRIINISSGAAMVTMPEASIYSASKAALNTLTRIWAQDLGKRKITVNSITVGATATDMFKANVPNEVQQMMIAKTALGRLGEPEDVAAVVAFLASEDGRWVTGDTIKCDGGVNLYF